MVFCLMETSKIGGEKLVFCDVGQGDGIFIKTEGRKILIDTGPKNGKIYACLSKYMPFWDRKIDILIITHSDFDHNGNEDEIKKIYKVLKLINNENIKVDDEIIFNKNRMNILNSKGNTKNEGSLVIDLMMNNRRILLTGDIDIEVENKLIWRRILNRKYDILKVSHHGSNTSTGDDFINVINPKISIISVGKNNYGHPDQLVIDKLIKINSKIYRTDEMGDIEFIF